MTTSLQAQPSPHPGECVDGLYDVTRRLTESLDVTIVHSDDVPADDIGWWESPSRTVVIRPDTTVQQQLWLLIQVWQLLVIGPSSLIGHREPLLTLVPDVD